MDETRVEIKERFVLFCLRNGLKRGKLAEELGVNPETLRRWFNFDFKLLPDLDAVYYLCNKYGMSADWLLGTEKKGGE
jgi:transcriptional regulator with XRE-family HTH domain